MKKSAKTEIVIPTWASRTGPGYWGDRDYSGYDNQSTSFWVPLRGVLPGDRHNNMNDDCRAVGDIGLYVYATVDGTVSIDLRLHDAGSMTLRESLQRITVLKRLFVKGKAHRFSDFERDSNVHMESTKAVDALGVKRAMIYHGINEPETFEPVGIALKRIADCIDERLDRMRQRHAACYPCTAPFWGVVQGSSLFFLVEIDQFGSWGCTYELLDAHEMNLVLTTEPLAKVKVI